MLIKPFCNEKVEKLGKQETFLAITTIFSVVGAFYGTALTVEYQCKKWWVFDCKNIVIKCLIILVVSLILLLLFCILILTYRDYLYR